MGTLKDKLLARIDERLFEYKSIPLVALLLVIIYVVKAQYVEAGTSAKDDVVFAGQRSHHQNHGEQPPPEAFGL